MHIFFTSVVRLDKTEALNRIHAVYQVYEVSRLPYVCCVRMCVHMCVCVCVCMCVCLCTCM